MPGNENKYSEIEVVYLEGLRKLSGERRLEIASDLFEAVKEIAKAGIIFQDSNIFEEQLKAELIRRINKDTVEDILKKI